MTPNYYLEYRFIPYLLEEAKNGRNPLSSLVDVKWIKETLTNNNVTIDWNGFSIDILDSELNKSTLEKGKYIAYTYPKIDSVPEAKYGVIDLETKRYYTFESDFQEGCWAIGSQDMNNHSLIRMVNDDLSLEEFIKAIKQPDTPSGNRSGCFSILILIAIVALIVLT